MVFFRLIISLFVLLFATQAVAQLPGLETAYGRLLDRTRDRIQSQNLISNGASKTCHTQALDIRADGRIDITVVFGYMDVSGGQDFNDSGNNLYGNGHVLDLDGKEALRSLLKARCPSRKVVACGFSGNGDTLTKRIRDRWSNTSLRVTVRLAAPAVTAYNSHNVGSYAAQQRRSSENTKNIFLSGLQTQDATIYMGHARSGGGPDFSPPVLYNNGHVNYSHYRSQRDGIRSMLGALQAASEPSSVIGVLACKSTGLFANSIRSKAPGSLLVTASDLFDYNDILPTGYAMIEAIVSQRCSNEFTNLVKVQPGSRNFINLFY